MRQSRKCRPRNMEGRPLVIQRKKPRHVCGASFTSGTTAEKPTPTEEISA